MLGSPLLLILGLTGCAAVRLDAGFPDVSAIVAERTAMQVAWNSGTELDEKAAAHVRTLLHKPLTADDCVQIALLNNRRLQAVYADLGVAQADLVQAGLFRNPVVDAAVLFPLSGARPDLQLGVVVGFLDVFYIPLRKRVAAARFEEAKLRVTGAVLDHAADVRRAFYQHQANEQLLELRQAVVQALTASLEVSRRLHEAGNISDLDLTRDRAVTEGSRLALRSAEVTTRESRERLNDLMGVWGAQTAWEVGRRLPDIPAEALEVTRIEPHAIERSLDLSQARQRILVAGQQLEYERATALVPETEFGVEAKREEGWKVGPTLAVPIPVFDQGQARLSRTTAELRRAQQEYFGLAVRVRAVARAARDRMLGARDRALYYRDILLPLHERIVNEAQLQYNAMQMGIVQLLRDRERQIETAVGYVEALRDYWLARTDLMHLSSGRLPASPGPRASADGGRTSRVEGANGH